MYQEELWIHIVALQGVDMVWILYREANIKNNAHDISDQAFNKIATFKTSKKLTNMYGNELTNTTSAYEERTRVVKVARNKNGSEAYR